MRTAVAVLIVSMVIVGAAYGSGRDPLTGVWVAVDVAGDGSTDRYVFGGPDANGVRTFTLIDSYGTYCETDGEGTGSLLQAMGTAVLDGDTMTSTIYSANCVNGSPGAFPIPDEGLTGQATLTADGLDFGGNYVAHRAGN